MRALSNIYAAIEMAIKLPLLSILLLFLSSLLFPAASAGRCNSDDKKALLAIKAAFNNAYHFASWVPSAACCDWYDVDCDPSTGRVTGLSIFQDANITGTIPAAIADLPYLTNLLLHHLPGLTGPIPSALSRLRRIQLFRISFTSISGPVPSWLSTLPSLSLIDLSFNSLSGSIPPSLSLLPGLLALHLDRNQLTGSIPDSFGSFPKSSPPDLYLSHNSLSGPIPASLGGPTWGIVDLSRNQLTGDASFLLGSNKPITQLDLSRNRLSFDLSKVSFPVNLTSLDLNHNGITASIPAQINQVTGLVLFNVSYNRLCGEIPAGAVTARFSQYEYFHNKCLCGTPLSACK